MRNFMCLIVTFHSVVQIFRYKYPLFVYYISLGFRIFYNAKRVRLFMLSSVASLAASYFPTLSLKKHDFWKSLVERRIVFWFSLLLYSENFHILRRIRWDFFVNVHKFLCIMRIFLLRFQADLNFLNRFSKNFSNISFHENPFKGTRVFPCVQTDMIKVIVAFRNFANVFNKEFEHQEVGKKDLYILPEYVYRN